MLLDTSRMSRLSSALCLLPVAFRGFHAILPPPMNLFITLLTILEVIVCLLLSLLVLMQRPRQEGLGAAFGSGVTDQMFGAQTTNVLQKATVYLGIALFGLTFLLAILISRQDDRATGKSTFVEPTDKVAVTCRSQGRSRPRLARGGHSQDHRAGNQQARLAEGNAAAPPPRVHCTRWNKPAAPTNRATARKRHTPATPAPIPRLHRARPTSPPAPAVPAPAK